MRCPRPFAGRVLPPVLDARTQQRLLAQMLDCMPGFAPSWLPRAGEAGWALLSVYARYLEILGEGLNRLPDRTLLTFLDLFGNALLPAQSARAPLVFTLLDTSPSDVELPARSTVAARLPPPAPSLSVPGQGSQAAAAPLFYTAQTITLTRARLAALSSVTPEADRYTDHVRKAQAGFVAFDDRDAVPHLFYLGHDSLLKLTGTSEVVLSFTFADTASTRRRLVLNWEYWSQDGWLPLLVVEDGTERFTREGEITLSKCCGPDSKQDAVDGVTSYWIRASVMLAQPYADIESIGCAQIDVAPTPNWAAKDVLTVNGVARGIVAAIAGKRVVLQQAEPFTIGESIAVAGKATAKVIAAPVTLVRIGRVYPFLGGDRVTVDGSAPVAIAHLSMPDGLELADALSGAQIGARLFLADPLPPLRPEGMDDLGPLPTVDDVLARVSIGKSDIQADVAYCDTSLLDLSNLFYPLGKQPVLFTTFYLACDEVFQLGGAQAEIAFVLAKPVTTSGSPVLTWEYFDGTSWRALGILNDFVDATAQLTTSGVLTFGVPRDWAQARVNDETKYWLRARFDSGDYGHPEKLHVSTDSTGKVIVTTDPATLAPPVVSKLRLSYLHSTPFKPLDHCKSYNDFAFVDHASAVRWPRQPFAPFTPLDDRTPTLHLGFSAKLPSGLVSMYAGIAEGSGEDARTSPFAWDYWTDAGWRELFVLDQSNGFTTSGLVQFVGPPDAAPRVGLGGNLHRIRARLKMGENVGALRFDALWQNAVWGIQGEQVQQQVLGDSNGNPGQSFPFPDNRVPVLPGETIEVREWTGHGDDWQTAVQDVPATALRFEREAITGIATAVWVRWSARDQLFAATADDRVYLLERATGLLRFGDGTSGMIPPAGARIVASFATGGGIVGNVAANSITELRTGIAYLQGVTNPLPATGGAAMEGIAAVAERGPQRFRNRDRSVAQADYEWLAREASPDVARVRCLPVTGPDGRPQPGCVTLLIAPQSSDAQPQLTPELARRVITFVARHAPATVATHVTVSVPHYVRVSVHATLVPLDPSQAARINEAALRALDRFLHPLNGGLAGNGWQFGEATYLSQIAALLEAIDGVDYASELSLAVDDVIYGDYVDVPPDALIAAGAHDVKIALAATPVHALTEMR